MRSGVPLLALAVIIACAVAAAVLLLVAR